MGGTWGVPGWKQANVPKLAAAAISVSWWGPGEEGPPRVSKDRPGAAGAGRVIPAVKRTLSVSLRRWDGRSLVADWLAPKKGGTNGNLSVPGGQ